MGANRAGSRGGSHRPESRKGTPSGLFQWLGRVLVECRGGVGSSWSSRPLFIGGSRGGRERGCSGEQLRRGSGLARSLGGQAASVRCTGAVPPLILVGLGVMAPVHGGVAARARRRQRARSAPSGSRRGWQRALGSGRPRGALRWLGRRWVAPSALRLSLAAAKPPLASVTGRRTFCCSSPTSARCQAFVRCRNKREGTRSKATSGHYRDRQPSLKKTTVSY